MADKEYSEDEIKQFCAYALKLFDDESFASKISKARGDEPWKGRGGEFWNALIEARLDDKPDSGMKPMKGKGEEINKQLAQYRDEPWAKEMLQSFQKMQQ